MQTFFYCDSHESQQQGKTPRVKIFKKHVRSIFSPFQAISSNFDFFNLKKNLSKISKIIFNQFSRHFRQFRATLVFSIFDEKKFLCKSSDSLKHLRQSSGRSSGNNLLYGVDQWEAKLKVDIVFIIFEKLNIPDMHYCYYSKDVKYFHYFWCNLPL